MTADARSMTFRQIARDLEHQISNGRYRPKEKLPSLTEMAAIYGVAVSTIKRSVDLLRDRDLVYGISGKGIFVSKPRNAEREPDDNTPGTDAIDQPHPMVEGTAPHDDAH